MNSTTPTIGLQADPGVPERVARAVAESFLGQITQRSSEEWRVEISAGELPLAPEGTIQLLEHAPRLLSEHGWEYFVYLTDLPRYIDGHAVLCAVSTETRAALISLPPLGMRGSQRAPVNYWPRWWMQPPPSMGLTHPRSRLQLVASRLSSTCPLTKTNSRPRR